MLFNSFEFLIFFPLVTLLYFLLPHKYRWFLLLAASCWFYMAFIPEYILILGFTIVVDYIAGICIEQSEGKRRLWFLISSLIANIGVLAVFKYYNFLNDNFTTLLEGMGMHNAMPVLKIALPIGLSFHTFQAMSYTIEVYRGNHKAERHFGIYALYVMFYPQLVAGPIERPQNMLYQFYEKHQFSYYNVTEGLKLMAWGLFKKVVIADRLSLVVNHIYDSPGHFEGLSLVIAAVFFSFQIFCDFSGYSDMALGASQVMGFRLMQNFNRPYSAASVSEFWGRWHMSLSSWFKDYLYIPLGGNRVSVPRWYLNIFIVFLLSGLWHGAGWTFIAWGALHGFYTAFGTATKSYRHKLAVRLGLTGKPRFNHLLSVATVFVLVTAAWVFFRAKNFKEAEQVFTGMARGWHTYTNPAAVNNALSALGVSNMELTLCFILIGFLEWIHYLERKGSSIRQMLAVKPAYIRWAVYYSVVTAIIVLGVFNKTQFIYFQF